MADPSLYTYESPLKGWEGGEALSNELVKDGPNAKSLPNPAPTRLSDAYTSFTSPISNDTRGGFDIHIYYVSSTQSELQYARELHTRIRREFPELRIYRMFDEPIGPHPVGMFEVNIFDPKQFGAFVGWLVINRGPLSALVHPNTGDDVRDVSRCSLLRPFWRGAALTIGGIAYPARDMDGSAIPTADRSDEGTFE